VRVWRLVLLFAFLKAKSKGKSSLFRSPISPFNPLRHDAVLAPEPVGPVRPSRADPLPAAVAKVAPREEERAHLPGPRGPHHVGEGRVGGARGHPRTAKGREEGGKVS
jgi:hypothetical protein